MKYKKKKGKKKEKKLKRKEKEKKQHFKIYSFFKQDLLIKNENETKNNLKKILKYQYL